jgi:invasion protein IalB
MLLLALMSPALAGAQSNETQPNENPEVTRREMGDWSVLCTADGTQCAMQQVGRTAQGEDALMVEIRKYPEPQAVEGRQLVAFGVFLVPLGVLLEPQLALQVDGNDLGRAPYFRCRPDACEARVPLDQNVIDSFIRGARARFIFVAPNGDEGMQEVAAEVSLSGFTRAYNSLP